MLSWLSSSKYVYILSNLIVIPAVIIPKIDFLSNISFFITFLLLIKTNFFLLALVFLVFIIKNNTNYRFHLLLKQKGEECSKSDYDCVYLYAWCTLLRYFLIGTAAKEIYFFLMNF